MSRGLATPGLAALDAVLARHVEQANVPGLVALVARGDDVHVAAIGHKAAGDGEPIGRDAIFGIASITQPIAGVAAMLLIQDGAMALDDPVRRWLPELAEPRVLRTLESELDDTVPAERPITVEDVLSFRFGFGLILDPGPFPIQRAERELGLRTLTPPWPPVDLTSGEWLARLGSLPLLDQPGTRWRYNTGAPVAGVLIERVAGRPLGEVLAERIFEPLGMADTAFTSSTGPPAGMRPRRSFPAPPAGWSPPWMTCGRSLRCWPQVVRRLRHDRTLDHKPGAERPTVTPHRDGRDIGGLTMSGPGINSFFSRPPGSGRAIGAVKLEASMPAVKSVCLGEA